MGHAGRSGGLAFGSRSGHRRRATRQGSKTKIGGSCRGCISSPDRRSTPLTSRQKWLRAPGARAIAMVWSTSARLLMLSSASAAVIGFKKSRLAEGLKSVGSITQVGLEAANSQCLRALGGTLVMRKPSIQMSRRKERAARTGKSAAIYKQSVTSRQDRCCKALRAEYQTGPMLAIQRTSAILATASAPVSAAAPYRASSSSG